MKGKNLGMIYKAIGPCQRVQGGLGLHVSDSSHVAEQLELRLLILLAARKLPGSDRSDWVSFHVEVAETRLSM